MEKDSLPMKEKLEYADVLFSMLIQTQREIHDPEAYANNVELIETTLHPYKDTMFIEEMKKNDVYFAELAKTHGFDNQRGKSRPEVHAKIDKIRMVKKLECIMNLARRKGLLPEESVTHIMGDDNY